MKRIQLENRTDLKSEIPLESPYCIYIDPSNACNFKCNFCMNKKITHPEIMHINIFKKIIDDLQEFNSPVKTIRLYGFGEPLINPSFFNMVRYAKASNKVLNVDTTTNASLLDNELINELIDSNIDRVNISIEAVTTEKYRTFTNNKTIDYETIVSMIDRLYHKKKSTIVFVKVNGDFLNDSEKQLFIDTFKPISDGYDIEHTMNCWYDNPVDDVNKSVGIYGQPLESVKVCPYPFYSFMIQSAGIASVCFLDWDSKMIIGNVNTQSVKDIWTGDRLKSYQMLMLQGYRTNHPICKNCDQLVRGNPVNLDDSAEDILKRIPK
jgi:MoaA/NifB/PqqE/SkfB family radical SAM enzyme